MFTDLDGSLLDHDTYDWQPARPALDKLRQFEIPLVLVSSKTLAELEDYRQQLQLDHPVVAENGAAMRIPAGYFSGPAGHAVIATPRSELRTAYEAIKSAHAFDCLAFFELGIDGIVRETGLTQRQAARADDRLASEPILWRDSKERAIEFANAADELGLRCIKGGRFLHLIGNTGKEQAVGDLMAAYADKWPAEDLTSVSLGDGPNDLGMLSCTDIAVVIPGKHTHPMTLNSSNRILRPASPGPVGWNEAMLALLTESQEIGRCRTANGE